jgi:CheY-like chemotaxis protein
MNRAVAEPRLEQILVAEDNEVNRMVVLAMLRQLGRPAVDVAVNGWDVLAALERRRYDIILMDCQMPGLDGYDATLAIRERDRGEKYTWIVAVTGHALAGDREKCLAAGMDDYLTKPLATESLHAALKRASTSSAEPLDGCALRRFLEDWDEDEFADLLELLEALAPAKLLEIHHAVRQSHADQLSRAAHALKGCCINFGTSPLGELCRRIEVAALAGDMALAAELSVSLGKEWRRLSDALRPYRKAGGSGQEAAAQLLRSTPLRM